MGFVEVGGMCVRFDKKMVVNNRGVTLIELIMVVSILAIMVLVAVGTINPVGLVNKGNDTRRKADLKAIRTAFEEYYSDRNCYPNNTVIEELVKTENCGSRVFSPWLSVWPCDPKGGPYYLVAGNSGCPNFYAVMTKLDNVRDGAIPDGWGEHYSGKIPVGGYTVDQVNFGLSSSNYSWYTTVACQSGVCSIRTANNGCSQVASCTAPNCYQGGGVSGCDEECVAAACP